MEQRQEKLHPPHDEKQKNRPQASHHNLNRQHSTSATLRSIKRQDAVHKEQNLFVYSTFIQRSTDNLRFVSSPRNNNAPVEHNNNNQEYGHEACIT